MGRPFPLPALVLERARDEGEAAAIVSLDQRQSEFVPFQFVVVPVLAPEPIAWVAPSASPSARPCWPTCAT